MGSDSMNVVRGCIRAHNSIAMKETPSRLMNTSRLMAMRRRSFMCSDRWSLTIELGGAFQIMFGQDPELDLASTLLARSSAIKLCVVGLMWPSHWIKYLPSSPPVGFIWGVGSMWSRPSFSAIDNRRERYCSLG